MSRYKFLIGVLLSLFFIYIIIWEPRVAALFAGRVSLPEALFGRYRIDWGELSQVLVRVRVLPLVICFLVNPFHVLVRAHRWKLMISPLGRLRTHDSFSLQMVGYLANAALPLRMGEVVRGVLLGRYLGISRASSLATVVTERALDVVTTLCIFTAVSFFFPFPAHVKEAAFGFGAVGGAVLALVLYLALSPQPLQTPLGRLLTRLPGRIGGTAGGVLERFTAGFTLPRSWRVQTVIIAETVLLWSLYAFQGWLVLHAFGFDRTYPLIVASPLLAALVVLLLSSLGLSIPSAPGAVGTFHAVAIFGLSLFGVPTEPATGFAIVIHAVSILYYLVFGIPFMWREGMKLGQMWRLRRGSVGDA